MNKLELMQLTEFENADSAMPEPWLEEMGKAGFDRSDLLFSIAWSYKKSSWGAPVILPLEFLRKMEDVRVTVKIGNNHADVPLFKLVTMLMKHDYEVRLEEKEGGGENGTGSN